MTWSRLLKADVFMLRSMRTPDTNGRCLQCSAMGLESARRCGSGQPGLIEKALNHKTQTATCSQQWVREHVRLEWALTSSLWRGSSNSLPTTNRGQLSLQVSPPNEERVQQH
jgi:hypothetical protein